MRLVKIVMMSNHLIFNKMQGHHQHLGVIAVSWGYTY